MSYSKGYYCLIQYCPDLSRGEAANVGVLLFCPEREFIGAHTSSGNGRIRQFFGSEGRDWRRIGAMKAAIEDRLEIEGKYIRTLSDLENFISMRANEIQITYPRPMKVSDPSSDLKSLFEKLVGGRARAKQRRRFESRIDHKFRREGVAHLVERNVRVDVPLFKRKLRVPFGFRNGRYNLIQPIRFVGVTRSTTEARACRLATEGRSLRNHSDSLLGHLQLMVVGQFSSDQSEESEVVCSILNDSEVPFYRFDDLQTLVDEIRQTAQASHGKG